jgi:hypothetical protein
MTLKKPTNPNNVNLPQEEVKICGEIYRIVVKPELEMNNNLGLCHADRQEIWVNQKNTEQSNVNVLLHECVHAIDYLYDLDMSERQVNVISNALIAFGKDNPELMHYFFGIENNPSYLKGDSELDE